MAFSGSMAVLDETVHSGWHVPLIMHQNDTHFLQKRLEAAEGYLLLDMDTEAWHREPDRRSRTPLGMQ